MSEAVLDLETALASLPAPWPEDLLPAIRAQLAESRRKLVVLDDDPTGTQTVHQTPVLTTWTVDALAAELAAPGPVFYVLTNSRSLPLQDAQALNAEIGQNLAAAARAAQRDFGVVSRSDSTLRGHYPGEVEALTQALGMRVDATLLIPFFLEGGRYTLNNIHYVAEGDRLTPAAQTPFAQDAAFGYRASYLPAWVEEKTGGQVPADAVATISLSDLRQGGPDVVCAQLMALQDNTVCVVNAAALRDLEVLVAALLRAEAAGKRFLYRTAASFVQVRAGLAARPLLTAGELGLAGEGGALFVVGSYVPKTTGQVNALLAQPGLLHVEVDVPALLDQDRRAGEIARARVQAATALAAGQDVVLATSRTLVTGADAASSLAIGQQVSAALVEIVGGLGTAPRYLVAKGGITASDIATKALGIRRALVLGQILPGVPVWQTGPECRFPGLAYVVFPGNVGGADALVEVRNRLQSRN
ncbi:MAG TPA: four-carbon acid sugar kinase family protein [Caldilineaceae bacterium]|nr:four-carbon acid sugar kinase family protein [Caldilineaceae bacterium]